MTESQAGRPSIWSEINQGVVWANLAISLLAVGSQAAAMKLLGLDEFLELGSLFWRTAPLTVAFAIIAATCIWQWKATDNSLFATLIIAAVALASATFVANWWGDLRVTKPVSFEQIKGHWFLGDLAAYCLGMLASYYMAYGPTSFYSSLVLGSLLGWIWWKIHDRHLASKPIPVASIHLFAEQDEAPHENAPPPTRPRRRRAS